MKTVYYKIANTKETRNSRIEEKKGQKTEKNNKIVDVNPYQQLNIITNELNNPIQTNSNQQNG